MKKSILWKTWQYPKERKWDFASFFLQENWISDHEWYFAKKYPEWLYPENLLPDIDIAVERIEKAIKNNERIVVFGDYDCDGIPGTAICVEVLQKLWANVSYRLPHREKDGYWLKKYFIDDLKSKNVDLVITVDNWIAAFEECKYAKELWIDIIITDHHETHEWKIPEAIAVINPQISSSQYPMKEICWANVAWKLMIALAKKMKWEKYAEKHVRDRYIDLVALSTVTDIMPLIWENRIIVSRWLEDFRNTENSGILEIFKIMNLEEWKEIDADFLAFQLWPRINAAWRMDDPYFALQLLLWKTNHAIHIESLNEKRKVTVEEALAELKNVKDKMEWVVILESKNWNAGIIWLIAWKITEKYNLPSIILQEKEDSLSASCRAPVWFNMFQFLGNFRELFSHFWGHAQACWFSISKSNYKIFKEKAKELWVELLAKSPLENILNLKYEIFRHELTHDFLKELKRLEPFWHWNRKPVFLAREIQWYWDSIWDSFQHLVWNIWWARSIWFNLWEHTENLKKAKSLDLAITLELRKWKWVDQINVQIEDAMIN